MFLTYCRNDIHINLAVQFIINIFFLENTLACMLTTLNNLIFMTWLQLSNTKHHGKGFQILAPWLVSIKFSELTFKNQLFNCYSHSL